MYGILRLLMFYKWYPPPATGNYFWVRRGLPNAGLHFHIYAWWGQTTTIIKKYWNVSMHRTPLSMVYGCNARFTKRQGSLLDRRKSHDERLGETSSIISLAAFNSSLSPRSCSFSGMKLLRSANAASNRWSVWGIIMEDSWRTVSYTHRWWERL